VKDVFKRALANQYQMILVMAAAALSVATVSPFPLLMLLGGEMLAMPFLLERIQKRLEIEKKYAARQVETLSQEQRYEQLSPEAKGRFGQLRRLCASVQENYKGLSAESQGIVAEQTEKFDAILATALQRLWLVQKYEQMGRAFDPMKVKQECDKLRYQLSNKEVQPRVREALEQNIEIKEKLLETVERNTQSRTALLAELDSVESLLQLLLQKSVAATDAEGFAADLEDILSQAEADAASIQEMEQLMGAMPELSNTPTLSERVRQSATQALPFVPRGRQKG
jgi:hypothetical protein